MTSKTIPTIADRVAAGIKLLDKKGPADWRSRVKTETLDILCGDNCILGQIYAVPPPPEHTNGFGVGQETLGIDLCDVWKYGFIPSPSITEDNAALIAEWTRRLSTT